MEPGDIRDAMHKVFNKILLHGILPALGQQISHVSKLGIFESQNCLGCLKKIPRSILGNGSEVLSEILPKCTGQIFSQTLCTTIVESTLLAMVRGATTMVNDDLQHPCR
jgi:hypothetical protein